MSIDTLYAGFFHKNKIFLGDIAKILRQLYEYTNDTTSVHIGWGNYKTVAMDDDHILHYVLLIKKLVPILNNKIDIKLTENHILKAALKISSITLEYIPRNCGWGNMTKDLSRFSLSEIRDSTETILNIPFDSWKSPH